MLKAKARQRGFQHGYLLPARSPRRCESPDRMGARKLDGLALARRAAVPMFVPRLDTENLAELDGIAEGARAAGVKSLVMTWLPTMILSS